MRTLISPVEKVCVEASHSWRSVCVGGTIILLSIGVATPRLGDRYVVLPLVWKTAGGGRFALGISASKHFSSKSARKCFGSNVLNIRYKTVTKQCASSTTVAKKSSVIGRKPQL